MVCVERIVTVAGAEVAYHQMSRLVYHSLEPYYMISFGVFLFCRCPVRDILTERKCRCQARNTCGGNVMQVEGEGDAYPRYGVRGEAENEFGLKTDRRCAS